MRQDRRSGPLHMRRIERFAGRFQSEIGFDRSAEIELAPVEQLPAPMGTLRRPQIAGDTPLDIRLRGAEVVLQQDIFGRDRGVGFELEYPMPILMLQ